MSRWHMNRAGFVNYWNFGETIYEFSNGKLLLRGSNGSGKSISTASILPLLLDGNTSARRLDPLGSADRKIEDYVLGEPGVSDKEDETAYVFLEYKKEDEDRFFTSGIGIRARKGGRTEKWYFILTDNRRVDIDFHLQEKVGINQHQPLSRLQLTNKVAEGGRVVQKASEYAELVNRHIFGFDTKEAFQDTIQLMLDLRRPKLSKDFAPSVIYRILESSLPAISDGSLSTISRSLQDLDDAKNRLDSARSDSARLGALERIYNRYNDAVSVRIATKVLEYDDLVDFRTQEVKELSDIMKSEKEDLEKHKASLETIAQELDVLSKETSRLERHEVYNLQESKDDYLVRIKEFKSRKDSLNERIKRKSEHIDTKKNRVKELEFAIYTIEKEISSNLTELENYADDQFFHQEHHAFSHAESFDFLSWRSRISKLKDELKDIAAVLGQIMQLNESIASTDLEISGVNEKIAAIEFAIETQEKEFMVMLGLIETDFNTWQKTINFEISSEAWHETFARLNSLVESEQYAGKISQPIMDCFNQFNQQQEGLSARNQISVDQLNQEYVLQNKELKTWKNMRLPIPNRSIEAQKERDELKESGIEFRPFYELIEFREATDEVTRSNLESALMATGILDALVAMENLDLKYNAQLKAQEVILVETLETYLKPSHTNSSISSESVRVLLSSIVVEFSERESVSIGPDGSYHLGILQGASQGSEKACYIGKEAQENYRQQKIRDIESIIADLNVKIIACQTVETDIRKSLSIAQTFMDTIPSDGELTKIRSNINVNQTAISSQLTRRGIFEEAKLTFVKKRAGHREVLEGFEKRFETKLNIVTIEKELEALLAYEDVLFQVENDHRDKVTLSQETLGLIDDIKVYELELDEASLELKDSETEIAALEANVQSIETQLQLHGAAEISKKISDNKRRSLLLQRQSSELQSITIVNLSSALTSHSIALESAVNDLDFFEKLARSWRELFSKNYSHHQLYSSDDDLGDKIRLFAQQKKANALDRENRIVNELKSYISENQYNLSEYGPELLSENPAGLEDWMEDLEIGYQPYIDLWSKSHERENLSCLNDHRKRSTVFAVTDSLRGFIQQQEVYISEEDRKLFEDILYNSVGKDLRRLIENAEQWTHKMNAILSAQDNYRGLKLFIEWRPNRAQQEDEMNTSELVELLRKPAEMMDESDLESMTAHFRARVDQAKILMEKDETMQTLQDVMKFVLDYRNWFSFRINYEKDLGAKRELTNNHFNKFSGGEKAIAMYLPLFTAIYARYDDAQFETPKIIALDEAFAGIDDANIAELFKAMDDLGFDYILNSQALWGDYETVNNLNIYQLIRERGSNVVVNIPFYWNGSYRREIVYD